MRCKKIILPPQVSLAIDKIVNLAKPVSIFVYGSRTRDDYTKQSDFEVGLLFNRDKKWERSQLATLHGNPNLNLFPFILEDFRQYKLDTPFPKALFLRELIVGAITIAGEKVLENMEPPEVRLSDLLEVVSFQLAYALAAVQFSCQKDWITTRDHFTKSALFGVRALIILKTGNFPLGFNEIFAEAGKLGLNEESRTVLKQAIEVRKGKEIDRGILYKNITFLNQIVYPKIKSELTQGDRTVLEGHPISSFFL